MKLLYVTQSLGKAGAEKLVLDISNNILKMFPDIRVKIVALSHRNEYPELSKDLDIEYCDSSVSLSVLRSNKIDISAYEKIVDSYQPDIIHSHTYKAELVSRENPRAGIKYFTHVHSDIPEFESFSLNTLFSKSNLTRFYERLRIFKRYQLVNNQFITISTAVNQKLLEQLPRYWHKNIHLLNNAIEFQRFSKYKLPVFPEKRINIVSVGRLTAIKNYPFQLKVLHELLKNDNRFHLTIVGDGSEEHNLKALAAELNLNSHVAFMHNTSDIPEVLSSNHIYIHTASKEGFSLSTLEAMAAGLPVVSLDAGGNRDLFVNGVNGVLLNSDVTSVEFATKIMDVVSDRDKYNEIANAARLFASGFDIVNYVDKIIHLYKDEC